ncbi:MAG: phosphoserine phosphatase SerB [Rhodobacteraceae bacterium]|nr:phosphoserine phosphatase SerB [Paracoccaceae bacterium]
MAEWVMVLTSASGVSDQQVAAACSGLDTVAPRRLSDCAVEVALRGARPAVALAGVDVNFVPAANRRKKLLIADMDSTIISVECIDELADFAGIKEAISAITEEAMRGEMGFEESLVARVALLRGLGEGALKRCYDERIWLNPGARQLVQGMNAEGAHTALVSGGFTYFTVLVAADAGFVENRANVLQIVDGALTGAVEMPILGREAKLEAMDEMCAERGITRSDVIAVGDGANDLAMIEAAGIGVAYKAKPALKAAANVVLDHSGLSALLALQGMGDQA